LKIPFNVITIHTTMEATAPQESEPSTSEDKPAPPIIVVAEKGNVILDVTFLTSKETLRAAKKSVSAQSTKLRIRGLPPAEGPQLKPTIRVAYRVQLSILQKQSKYFRTLLSDTKFHEARVVQETLSSLVEKNLPLTEAEPKDLPWVLITDDDDAAQQAGREVILEDLLRILHSEKVADSRKITTAYLTTLALLADRFDCTKPVSKYMSTDLRSRYKWSLTKTKPAHSTGTDRAFPDAETEKILRQKILIAWLLDQPLRLHPFTRELIIRGSIHWTAFQSPESKSPGAWWDLPADLEAELQFRRECILNTIASVQRHFMALYASKERQCKLGYDTSAACDVFQLGQMLKFFTSRNLLTPVDFGPASLDRLTEQPVLDIDEVIATLRQCPSYQIDKNHTNCGLRTRMLPILDYINVMLSSGAVSIGVEWKDRAAASWMLVTKSASKSFGDFDETQGKQFVFTRQLAGDQRLRYAEALYTVRLAKELFTADSWDWTPEY
jgi:hypothetical protein